MSNKGDIHIFMSCDEKFLNHLIVVINSAKYHTSRPIHLFLCTSNKQAADFFQEKLVKYVGEIFSFEIIIFGGAQFNKIFKNKIIDHPIECYFRICMGTILPTYVKKVIYIDADIIINYDLARLFDLELNGIIGGVEDYIGKDKYIQRINQDFSIELKNYIYAGMLLVNVDQWRKTDKEEQMLNFLKDNLGLLKMMDMDLINIFFKDDILIVSPLWNVVVFHGELTPKITEDPYIYHLIGPRKGDSWLYPHYGIRKLYQFYSEGKTGLISDILQIIVFLFIGKPISLFYKAKAEIRYKHRRHNHISTYLSLLLFFFPPVTFEVIKESKKIIKHSGYKILCLKIITAFK